MKIKRFVAADMRSAFALVRQEHGPDAVILSNRMTEDGVEIVAASNYDEALVQRTLDAMRPASAGTAGLAELEPSVPAPTSASKSPPAASATAPPVPLARNAVARAPSPAEAAADYFRRKAGTPPPSSAPAPSETAELPPDPSSFSTDAFAARLAACLPPAAPAPETSIAALGPEPLPCPAPVPVPVPVPVQSAASADGDEQLLRMRAELAAMRQMIEREMSRLTDERLRGSSVRAQALDMMEDYGFDAGLCRDIALEIPADTEPHRGRGLMLGLLSRRLPIAPADPLDDAGIIALVGPTGAGKTTTIAKLAAAYAARHHPRDVALVTTDTLRVGGREQLHGYGRQLGVAVHEADSDGSLAATLERLRDYRLVLIDTAGLGQRDRNLIGQLNWLRSSAQVRTLLVLPANSHFSDLDEVVRRFSGARPQGVVLTKLDETGRLGSALSVAVDHRLPLVWVADGQRVPEDLHRAKAANLVLRLDQLRREADAPCAAETPHVA